METKQQITEKVAAAFFCGLGVLVKILGTEIPKNQWRGLIFVGYTCETIH